MGGLSTYVCEAEEKRGFATYQMPEVSRDRVGRMFCSKKMSADKPIIAAIGLTFSNDTFKVLMEVLRDPRFHFTGEGTMATGYEFYVAPEAAEEAIIKIRNSPMLEGHKVEFYERVRNSDDGTRYDRLIDHLKGEDPDRPSVGGIEVSCDSSKNNAEQISEDSG